MTHSASSRGQRRVLLLLTSLFIVLSSSSCGDGDSGREAIVVTADWLNRSLTVFDLEKLVDEEGTVQEAIVGTVDLAEYPPGPLELEITPDGKTAVVSVGPGFFQSGAPNGLLGGPVVPEGSALLLVDLESLQVVAALSTEDAPMGIAITPDGQYAYTANYGTDAQPGDSVSIIDIPNREIVDEFTVGSRPEQIAVDPEGELGVFNLTAEGGVRVFETGDFEETLTPVVFTGDDPSGVTFLEDSTRLVVANSGSSDLSVLDSSDLGALVLLDTVSLDGSFSVPYGVTYLSDSEEILVPLGVPSTLLRYLEEGDSLLPTGSVELGGAPFPLVAAVDQEERYAFVPHMAEGSDPQLSIVSLSTEEVRGLSWLSGSGPSYVAVWP